MPNIPSNSFTRRTSSLPNKGTPVHSFRDFNEPDWYSVDPEYTDPACRCVEFKLKCWPTDEEKPMAVMFRKTVNSHTLNYFLFMLEGYINLYIYRTGIFPSKTILRHLGQQAAKESDVCLEALLIKNG